MLRPFSALLNVSGYAARKAASVDNIVSRYARGNVALQNGAYITEAELTRRSEQAVRTMRKIDKSLRRS
jgi:hypothetical protein